MKICVLDIGGTFVKAALMDEEGHFIKKWKVKSKTQDEESFLETLDECIRECVDQMDGIAISMPGKIDSENGIAITGGAFAFINNMPIVALLEEKYHVKVAVDNDGKCAANAENWIGALQDVSSGLVYVIGTGIGGGIIIDNKVYRGVHFAAGELSCTYYDKNKGIDPEMNFWDTVSILSAGRLSASGLLGAYKMISNCEGEIDGIEFFKRVNDGETCANQVLQEFAKGTARYFYDLQAILDIERIAIGGGISEQEILLKTIKEEVDNTYREDLPLPVTKPQIVKCKFGNDANLIGALKNYLERIN